MVNCVESGDHIKEDEYGAMVVVKARELVGGNEGQGGFSRFVGEVGTLEYIKDVVGCEVGDELGGYNTCEDFGMDLEVGDGSVVRGIQGVNIRLFKDGGDGSYFEIRRDGAG